ncbi:MAG: hypothetical protein GY733_24115 [bacterium]|nr:hypothetical protein [bacterium]
MSKFSGIESTAVNTIRTLSMDAVEAANFEPAAKGLRHEPVALFLSRQVIATIDRSRLAKASQLAKGAYVLSDPAQGEPEVTLMASSSGFSLCLEASEVLRSYGRGGRGVDRTTRSSRWRKHEQQHNSE